MLQRNPLQPPRPFMGPTAVLSAPSAVGCRFISAEDFDATGVLAGVDPCESHYWWMPELYGPEAGDTSTGQATWRTSSRTTAAA